MKFNRVFNEEIGRILNSVTSRRPRDELVIEIMDLIRNHVKSDDALLRNAAEDVLDRAMKRSDHNGQNTLFPDDGVIALGNNQIVRRDRMTLEDHYARKRVVEANHKAVAEKAFAETDWLNEGIDLLTGKSPGTVRGDVI